MLLGNETWERRLRKVVQAINNTPRRIIANGPSHAVELDEVNVKHVTYKSPVGLHEARLPPGVKVRYLLFPGEDEGGNRRRATDPIWSMEIYDIDRTVVIPRQPVLYYLTETPGQRQAPRRNFVREELQVIPEDT